MADHRPLLVPKASQLIAEHLRGMIIRQELAAGDALPPESELMERYAVSRPTLREAYRVLESESLIVVKRGAQGGARVRRPEGRVAARYAGLILQYRGATVGDVFEAREIFEPACVRLLAERRKPSDVALLREAIVDHEHGSFDERVRIALRLHSLIVELAGNKTLALLSEMLYQIVESSSIRTIGDEGRDPGAVEDGQTAGHRAHQLVINLIEAGDADRAEQVWRTHLHESNRFLFADETATRPLHLVAEAQASDAAL